MHIELKSYIFSALFIVGMDFQNLFLTEFY